MMKFFSKQIIATFFSLSFLFSVVSAEGIAGNTDIATPTTPCASSNSCSTIASAPCTSAGDTITLKPGAGFSDYVITCTAGSTPTVTDVRIICKQVYCEIYEASTSKNTFVKSVCNAFRIVNGSAGKTFAAFAIIATGIGFFSGKVSWGLMIGVAAGIATMFGAPSIVAAISGQTANLNCDLNVN
jgi:type IV secretory pathway VirB2 component (pilin)